jgi:predicted alpha/beta hydrolase
VRHDYYFRQLRDWKASADIDAMTPRTMAQYARLCGRTLARAHARSGDRVAIAAYLGSSDRFDRAIAEFAERYADRNQQDYDALVAAEVDGRIDVLRGH